MDKVIEREGPVFWQALQDSLAQEVDALPSEFSGSITSFGGGIRVTVNKLGMAFNQGYTDLFYKRGATEIRCSALNVSPYMLKLCPTPDGKLEAKSTLGLNTMDASGASKHVMELMLDAISRK